MNEEDYAKDFVKSIEEDWYKDRLDKVLEKFRDNQLRIGCTMDYHIIIIYEDKKFYIMVDCGSFPIGEKTKISLATVESLLKDMSDDNA